MMKYYQQEKDYTCGIACLRMCFSAFNEDFAEQKTEAELEFLCESGPEYGTKPEKMVEIARGFAFEAEYVKNGSLEEIRRLQKEGYEVILLISVDVPHCIVYLGDDNNHIFYNDPWFGERKSVRIAKFTSEKTNYPFLRWRVETEPLKKYYPDLNVSDIEEYAGKMQYIKIKG